VAIAFAAGLLLALGLAFLWITLDQSIKGDDEPSSASALIPIGHIAYIPTANARRSELVALDAQSPSARRSKLCVRVCCSRPWISSESDRDHLGRTGRGEVTHRGKPRHLACSVSRKTLLIDADFRRPSQHRCSAWSRTLDCSNLILGDVTEDDA